MPEFLTHVLAGFILGTVLSFRFEWIEAPFVTAVMVGALLPDLTKVSLILSPTKIQALFGISFDWFALHTPFGAVLTATISSLLIGKGHRLRVFILLLLGVTSHFILDALLISPSRFSYVLLWPFRVDLVPLPMYLLSSDQWPTALTLTLAVAVWYLRRAYGE